LGTSFTVYLLKEERQFGIRIMKITTILIRIMKITTSLNTNIINRRNYQQVSTYLISASERNKTDRTELW